MTRTSLLNTPGSKEARRDKCDGEHMGCLQMREACDRWSVDCVAITRVGGELIGEGIGDVERWGGMGKTLPDYGESMGNGENVVGFMRNDDFPCNSCSERLESRAALQRHKKTSHRKRQQYKCEDCESVFTSNQTLKAHVQSVH